MSIDVLACLMIKRYEKITKHAMIRRGNSILIKELLKHEAYIINRHWGVNDMWLYYGNIKWIRAHYVT